MNRQLVIHISSYWHAGTGRGHGSALDAAVHRDGRGLPALPGRTVKGLVRDAVHRWESFGGFGPPESGLPTVTERLFGPYGSDGSDTWPGLLRFSDAELAPDVAEYLARHPELVDPLFRSHFSTAVDPATGTARDGSLRGVELVIPLTLLSTITTVEVARHRDLLGCWPDRVREALPLVQGVGSARSRGLGRAECALTESA